MTSSAHGRVWIGTSGWQYSHWRKRFYPEDLPRDKWLEHYSGLFDTVEVNSSFYGLPEPKSLDHWKESVPSGFRFALKFSRYGSHMKCLKDPRQTLPPFLECLRQLGSAAGPVLVQLKPKWNCNPERLGDFLAALPSSRRWAFEFRDASWFCGEVYSLLEKHNAAMVIHDMLERHPDEATADWSYYRFHGDHYQGEYSPQFLSAFADRLARQSRRGRDCFVYFNNDAQAAAVQNALSLKKYVGRRLSS